MAFSRGPTPIKHAHTKMIWTPEPPAMANRARCDGCGQVWKLVESPGRNGDVFRRWVVIPEGSDPGGNW